MSGTSGRKISKKKLAQTLDVKSNLARKISKARQLRAALKESLGKF